MFFEAEPEQLPCENNLCVPKRLQSPLGMHPFHSLELERGTFQSAVPALQYGIETEDPLFQMSVKVRHAWQEGLPEHSHHPEPEIGLHG